MNDAQLLAFDLTMAAVHLAPELSPKTRQLAAVVWFACAMGTAVRLVF